MDASYKKASALETALSLMLGVYMQNKGDDETLSKKEFGALLKKELPAFSKTDPDELFKSVDMNQDGTMEFPEFALLVANCATRNYGILQDIFKNLTKK